MEPLTTDGFIEVNRTKYKSKSKEILQKKSESKSISLEELCSILNKALQPYIKNISAGFIYGSRARKTNHNESDADIIIFWKKIIDENELYEIRNIVEKAIGIKTDFVSCYMQKKLQYNNDLRDIAYFENVTNDGKNFIGITNLNELIPYSIKLNKLKR